MPTYYSMIPSDWHELLPIGNQVKVNLQLIFRLRCRSISILSGQRAYRTDSHL